MLVSPQEGGDREQHSGTTGQDLSFTGSVERFVAKGSRIFTNLLNPSSQVLIKIKRAKTTKFSSLPIVQPNVRKLHLKYTSPETRVVRNRLMKQMSVMYPYRVLPLVWGCFYLQSHLTVPQCTLT